MAIPRGEGLIMHMREVVSEDLGGCGSLCVESRQRRGDGADKGTLTPRIEDVFWVRDGGQAEHPFLWGHAAAVRFEALWPCAGPQTITQPTNFSLKTSILR